HEANDRQVIETGRAVEFEEYSQLKDRSITWLTTKFPLRDAQGRIYAVAGISADITARKQAEEALRSHAARLEAAYKESESFSYSISHDLRAPLRAIDGFSRMLLKKHGDQFDEDSRRKFKVIRSNAQMMGKLIDDILSLSRLGRKQMSIELLDMDAIVREIWQELHADTANRNINLLVNSIPQGYGDRTLIKQVYSNLLGNAVKFTKLRNPALVEVGGNVHEDENVYYVKDNGAGFDMEYYDKLFGIFQRLHKPDEFEGTGVGLATVQRVIGRHGGRVWAEGKVDEGATFYFSLPVPQTR
ncbi:MAG: sensor histidine kinase, partial [Syntrophales bacterium]